MSNQLTNEFILNTSPQISPNNGINLITPQQIVNNQCNIAPQMSLASNASQAHVNNYSLNINNSQQINYSSTDLTQIQGQSMSQTAQIVLLPTQNINLANVPKQEQVQMILPNDVGYQIIPNVGVLVPTTILITDKNECILIPQNSQNMCQTLTLTASNSQANELQTNVTSIPNSVYVKRWIQDPNQHNQQILANVEFNDNSQQQLNQPEQECEYIALANTGTQTVLGGLPESDLNQTTQLISNNCQIVGIIDTNQIGILQNESTTDSQVLLAACIDPNENVNPMSMVGQETSNSYDINAFLASTISTLAVEKSDQNQAKQWLKDSFIVNRALKALKKTNSRSNHSNRPHQIWR